MKTALKKTSQKAESKAVGAGVFLGGKTKKIEKSVQARASGSSVATMVALAMATELKALRGKADYMGMCKASVKKMMGSSRQLGAALNAAISDCVLTGREISTLVRKASVANKAPVPSPRK